MISKNFLIIIRVILIVTNHCALILGNSDLNKMTKEYKEIISNRRQTFIDGENEKYKVIWETDLKSKEITFHVTVRTLGFVGFGISPNAGMAGSDIVIGGVFPNGTFYFADYFSVGNEYPELDVKQDWELLEAMENGTHTMLKFKRLFDTCDENDFKLGNDTSNLIWAFGELDVVAYHLVNRGSFSINLLDPPMPSIEYLNESIVSTWRISNDYEMSDDDTTYWCTLHRSPPLKSKHHVIGFEAYLPSDKAKAHTHHFIVHECRKPKTASNEISPFEPLLNSNGDHCFKAGNAALLHQYCNSYIVVWSTGGRRVLFPENVGYPIDEENLNVDIYYMLQLHCNNPNKLQGVKFEAGVNIFYTSTIREFEAGIMLIGHGVTETQVIPPKTPSFMTVGHCSSECTKEAVPSFGVNFFSILLHSHLAGKKMKLRQFRDGKEIPWVAVDNNYNVDYQQNRPLLEHIKMLPGDQLAMECIYNTTSRKNVTIGGFGSNEEMCVAFILYYPKIDLLVCGSSYSMNTSAEDFGIEKVQFVPGSTDTIVTAPEKHAGKRYSTVLNEINWTVEKVKYFQNKTRFFSHDRNCVSVSGRKTNTISTVTYPTVKDKYTPLNICNLES